MITVNRLAVLVFVQHQLASLGHIAPIASHLNLERLGNESFPSTPTPDASEKQRIDQIKAWTFRRMWQAKGEKREFRCLLDGVVENAEQAQVVSSWLKERGCRPMAIFLKKSGPDGTLDPVRHALLESSVAILSLDPTLMSVPEIAGAFGSFLNVSPLRTARIHEAILPPKVAVQPPKAPARPRKARATPRPVLAEAVA